MGDRNWVTEHNTTQDSPKPWHIAPLPEGASSHRRTTEGGMGGNYGGGSGGGQTPGRGPANRVQGGDERGRSQGGDMRDPEKEEEPWRRNGRRLRGGEEEPRGWRSLTAPEGGRDKAKPEEWSPEVQDGRRQTKAEPEGQGSPAELVDCRATVERRELGAMVEPTGQRAEVESGPRRLEVESR